MTLELVSFALCPYVQRTTTMLHEKGIAFDIKYIDLSNKPDWFLAISPRGKVPVLVVDGTPLFESAAINEYLDETQPPHLLPTDPLVRAQHRAWVEVANDLFAMMGKIVYAKTREDYEKGIEEGARTLARLEEAVQGPLFAGESFSIVDASCAPALHRLLILEAHSKVRFFEAFPKVDAWAHRIAARPSVQKSVLPDFDALLLAGMRARGNYFATALLSPASS
jgi:glutathione S-transferase